MAKHGESGGITTVDPLDAATRPEVDQLLQRVEKASDHPPLSEASRLAWSGAQDFDGLVLRSGGDVLAYAHLGQRQSAWSIEIAVDPERAGSGQWRGELLAAATRLATERGAREVRYWVNQHEAEDHRAPGGLGFETERDLLQMRVALPVAVPGPALGEQFTTRAFRIGEDEGRWLEVNNRAFDAHPEQSHWDLAMLEARERTGWFDPEGFIVCESKGRLAGSCWTKVHAERVPPLGEIYVISVDPSFQRHGLGRALAVAGLDWLADRVSVGMLYVEADNDRAVELYRSLGFTVDHLDRCYLLRPATF